MLTFDTRELSLPSVQLPMGASIVIGTCNEDIHISRLLEGIALQSLKDVEIILVDSGSTDRTLEIASQYSLKKVEHIQSGDFTSGYSLNQGISLSHGNLIVITSAHNPPVYPDWLEYLLAPFSDPQVALTNSK